MEDLAQQAKDQLEAIYEDGFAEINGREYHFSKMTHSQRRDVFAYYTSITSLIQNKNFIFLSATDFKQIEKLILGKITFDGMQLSKLPEHFDEFPEDYVILICTALGVISYPFLSGNRTN